MNDELKTKSVYCRDCKHYRAGFSDRHFDFCAEAKEIWIVGNYLAPGCVRAMKPSEQNSKNHCQKWEPRE